VGQSPIDPARDKSGSESFSHGLSVASANKRLRASLSQSQSRGGHNGESVAEKQPAYGVTLKKRPWLAHHPAPEALPGAARNEAATSQRQKPSRLDWEMRE
jgi:hypothetical protein